MTAVYIILIAVPVFAAAFYAVGEYFYKVAIKRPASPPNEYEEQFRAALTGTDREYMLAETAQRKQYLKSNDGERVSIVSRDGLCLSAKLFSVTEANKTAILVHGYKSAGYVDFTYLSGELLSLGYNILMIDQRASGESEGEATSFGVFERYDVEGWCRFVAERYGTEHKIVLFGCSMGAATVLMASELAGVKATVSGIVADCGYTSPLEQFRYIVRRDYHLPPTPILAAAELVCHRRAGWRFNDADAARAVKNTTVPILFIHGDADKYVPARFTIDNYEACASRRELLIVNGAPHAYSIYKNPKLYMAKLYDFLESI